MTRARILIVEDQRIVALNLGISLKSLGYSVVGSVSSGEEAIAQAARTAPDLILMDVSIEGEMDGIEAAREIRSRFDIPIVYVSAFSDREVLERAETTHPRGYLRKPFTRPQLAQIIDQALGTPDSSTGNSSDRQPIPARPTTS